ncbi:MAG: hypothetical protein ISR96_11490 [Nitrospira sp.]|nr:hypothetical protein [bacterium]MBL7050128.1 hypothetical protein [Nitrospira sp.]
MRKRQKITLVVYFYAVLILSFIYVPYVRYHADGAKSSLGHHLRVRFMAPIWETTMPGRIAFDTELMLLELLAITALAVATYLLFAKRDDSL